MNYIRFFVIDDEEILDLERMYVVYYNITMCHALKIFIIEREEV